MKKLLICLLVGITLFITTLVFCTNCCDHVYGKKEVNNTDLKSVLILDTIGKTFIESLPSDIVFDNQVTYYGYKKDVSYITPFKNNVSDTIYPVKEAVFFNITDSVFEANILLCDTIIFR